MNRTPLPMFTWDDVVEMDADNCGEDAETLEHMLCLCTIESNCSFHELVGSDDERV